LNAEGSPEIERLLGTILEYNVKSVVSADVYFDALQPDSDFYPAKKSDDECSLRYFLYSLVFKEFTQEACQIRIASKVAADAPGATHSHLITYANVWRPQPDSGKTSLLHLKTRFPRQKARFSRPSAIRKRFFPG
jgi:hypothetical protein